MKSDGIVRLSVSVVFIETPDGALTLIALEGVETEQAGAATEQLVEGVDKPGEGKPPIVARSGDSARLLQRGFRVTDRDTSCGRRSS